MLCDMNQTYHTISKLEYLEYILPSMLYVEDTDSLFEYMRILASQELNPTIIPPDILKGILLKIEEEIKSHARLKLCEDPETNIWSYYGTVKLTPIVLHDYLMLILECTFSGSILAYESVQSSQSTHVTSHLECACTI